VKLRTRVALIVLASFVPFAIGVALLQAGLRKHAAEASTADAIVDRMEAGGREACEAAPESWPRLRAGRRLAPEERRMRNRLARAARARKGRIFAYDAALRSPNPVAPPFPDALRADIESGDEVASDIAERERTQRIAVRMPWIEGPCAVLLVERRIGPGAAAGRAGALAPALLVSAAAALMAFLAAGPLVRRIRKLTDAVQRGGETRVEVGGASDEIAELAAAFDASRAQIAEQVRTLEARDEALRAYVANTTHDVMIPVTVLTGHLSDIERRVRAGRPVEAPLVTAALEEAHYLACLVANLSAAAKLEAGEPHVEMHAIDLEGVVERVIARHAPVARQKEVAIEHAVPGEPVLVRGDVTLVEQALGNLVHNAVRYGRANGHVAIVLERHAAERRFVLRVIDDGPGMTDEELARATERGWRGDAARGRTRSVAGGSGLGLAITRDVVERHGWTLTLARAEGGGLRAEISGAYESGDGNNN